MQTAEAVAPRALGLSSVVPCEKVSASPDCSRILPDTHSQSAPQRWIRPFDDAPSMIPREGEHAVDLEHSNPVNQSDEHPDTRQQETHHEPPAEKQHSPGPIAIQPGDCCHGIDKCCGENSQG